MIDFKNNELILNPLAHDNQIIRFWEDCVVQLPPRETTSQFKITFFPIRSVKVVIRTVGKDEEFENGDSRTNEIVLSPGKQQTIFAGGHLCLRTYHTDFSFDPSHRFLLGEQSTPEIVAKGVGQQDVDPSLTTPKTRVPRKS